MKKRNGVILAVIGYIVFFFCVEGWGADWKPISIDTKGSISVLEIDVASISRQPDNIVRVLVKTTYSKETVADWVKHSGEKYKDFSHAIYLGEYHCTERKSRILSRTHYSSGGEIIFSENSPRKWSIMVPGSPGDTVFKELCK